MGDSTPTIKGRKASGQPETPISSAEEPERGTEAPEGSCDGSEHDRLESVGFQLIHGAYRR